MMNNYFEKLKAKINDKKSHLCVGLDPDIEKLPNHFEKNSTAVKTFLLNVIDAVREHTAVFKPNLAFYGSLGKTGIDVLYDIIEYLKSKDELVILDSKMGDIGNTARHYAKFAFMELGADCVTVNPLMGEDSINPFAEYKEKGLYALTLTSNKSADDFLIPNDNFMNIADKLNGLGHRNIGMVVGATHPQYSGKIFKKYPAGHYLIPGIGAQGGSLESAEEFFKNNETFVINSSRGILYAGSGRDFPEKSAESAEDLKNRINSIL